MKVLMLNGSCNPKGCTYTALTEVGNLMIIPINGSGII